jgi:hypothetical protein
VTCATAAKVVVLGGSQMMRSRAASATTATKREVWIRGALPLIFKRCCFINYSCLPATATQEHADTAEDLSAGAQSSVSDSDAAARHAEEQQ